VTVRAPKKRAAKFALVAKPVGLLADVRKLILQAREGVTRAVDSGLSTLYWHVCRRVRQDILREKRAEYGGRIVSALGRRLEKEFGRGFGEKNLRRMVQFTEQFPDVMIVAALLRQLGWTHFTILLPIGDPLKREFYAEMCRIERALGFLDAAKLAGDWPATNGSGQYCHQCRLGGASWP